MTTTDHYEMPHPDADACDHAGVGKACRPCLEVLYNLHLINLCHTTDGKQLMAEAWDMGWAGGAYGKDRHDNPHMEAKGDDR